MSLTADNGMFVAAVDRVGARVSSVIHAASGTEFLLRTPWADEEFSGEYASDSSNEEWHRRYAGGWHTLVPHSGDARRFDGVEHPFHGEAAWRTWRIIQQDPASCTLEIVLRTVPFAVRRRVDATNCGIHITQTVTNLSDRQIAFSWTEHPAFSAALIGPNSSLTIGSDEIDIAFPADGEAVSNFRTVPTAGRSSLELRNDDAGIGIMLRWEPDLFPFLYVWQEHHGVAGFPWWGQVNTIGLEPASRPYDLPEGPLGPLVLAGGACLSATFSLEPRVRPAAK